MEEKRNVKDNEKFVKLKIFLNNMIMYYGGEFIAGNSVDGITLDEAIDDLFDGEQGIPTNNRELVEKLEEIKYLALE
jgi:hypothetical protein